MVSKKVLKFFKSQTGKSIPNEVMLRTLLTELFAFAEFPLLCNFCLRKYELMVLIIKYVKSDESFFMINFY